MARKYDVTRNFEIYEVEMVLYNDSTEMTEKSSIMVDDKNISKKTLEKYIVEKFGTRYTLVKYSVQAIGSVMYGMTSETFRRYGVRLNPDNRQPIEQGTEQDTEQDTEQGTEQDA